MVAEVGNVAVVDSIEYVMTNPFFAKPCRTEIPVRTEEDRSFAPIDVWRFDYLDTNKSVCNAESLNNCCWRLSAKKEEVRKNVPEAMKESPDHRRYVVFQNEIR